jgi:cholesterol oxidase
MGHRPATAHPLGGCAIGRDRSAGVVDHRGRVFDARPGTGTRDVHPGLMVLDGAAVPRSLGANPLLTITALAERAMLHLAREGGWHCDAAPVHATAPVPVQAPGAVAHEAPQATAPP